MTFATTEWSVVLAAGATSAPAARAALEHLCRAYWYPLYVYLRRRGHDATQAEDLVQSFFTQLLERDLLASVDRGRGRFRSFMLTCLKHHVADQRDHARAAKRGGGRPLLPIGLSSDDAPERRYAHEPAHDLTPERLFERRWALALLEQTLGVLRQEYRAAGCEHQFEVLRATITGDGHSAPYPELAACLDMTVGAIKVAVHRLRRRYRDLLRSAIAATVADPRDVDAELTALVDALA
jgi:RNA polymerase sigma-70 factor (ECF subfamily)